MNINKLPKISEKIYLHNDPQFALIEGEAEEDKRVWVKVRQATERDHMVRAELMSQHQMKWSGAFTEVVQDNPIQRRAYEVYWTLIDVGNLLYEDGAPVFENLPTITMTFTEFEMIWGSLDPVIATAIHKAVLSFNPVWA